MNCKKVQELLLTDYIDKEASQAMQEEVGEHLKSCDGCRAFELILREKVSGPFRNVKPVTPPEEAWQKIKEEVSREPVLYPPPFFGRLREFLNEYFFSKKPAVVFATVITAVIAAVLVSQLPARKHRLVNEFIREHSEYMQSLHGAVNGELEQEVNLGTAIERYFF